MQILSNLHECVAGGLHVLHSQRGSFVLFTEFVYKTGAYASDLQKNSIDWATVHLNQQRKSNSLWWRSKSDVFVLAVSCLKLYSLHYSCLNSVRTVWHAVYPWVMFLLLILLLFSNDIWAVNNWCWCSVIGMVIWYKKGCWSCVPVCYNSSRWGNSIWQGQEPNSYVIPGLRCKTMYMHNHAQTYMLMSYYLMCGETTDFVISSEHSTSCSLIGI